MGCRRRKSGRCFCPPTLEMLPPSLPGPMVFRALSSKVQMHKCALQQRYIYFIFVIAIYVLALQTKIKE